MITLTMEIRAYRTLNAPIHATVIVYSMGTNVCSGDFGSI